MNLNLKNKGVFINMDNIGIHQHITKRLNTEGAVSYMKNKKQDYDNIRNKAIKINAFVNIKEKDTIESCEDFLQSFYKANCLADNFTIINIGTRNTLKIKNNSYKDDVLKIDQNSDTLEKKLNIKSFNIVYPDTTAITVTNKANFSTEKYFNSVNQQIVDSVAFCIAKKTTLKNGQIIFIDNGLHLFHASMC